MVLVSTQRIGVGAIILLMLPLAQLILIGCGDEVTKDPECDPSCSPVDVFVAVCGRTMGACTSGAREAQCEGGTCTLEPDKPFIAFIDPLGASTETATDLHVHLSEIPSSIQITLDGDVLLMTRTGDTDFEGTVVGDTASPFHELRLDCTGKGSVTASVTLAPSCADAKECQAR